MWALIGQVSTLAAIRCSVAMMVRHEVAAGKSIGLAALGMAAGV